MRPLVFLSIPNLRAADLPVMPALADAAGVVRRELGCRGPALTCPVHATLTTGVGVGGDGRPGHGVVANGFYWRERREVEMWTAWGETLFAPRWWDDADPRPSTALWFPLLAKGSSADFVCTPAPIHNPDGSESLWCYTKPEMLYGDLRDAFGHFPLKHFWGPLAGIESSRWIAASAVEAAGRFRPDFHFIYLPHLDYTAQKHGPDSPEAEAAAVALDGEIAGLIEGLRAAYRDADPVFVAASEYVITPVEAVACPNRVLREAGLLAVTDHGGEEHIDFASTPAWAMADHQIAHVFVEDAGDVTRVADALREADIAAAVLTGRDRADVDLDHPRSGDVVLLSRTDASFAYPWWFDDGKAPAFARIVDIHRKPGYDPVELFFDPATKSIPLDPSLVRGSHGLPTGAGGAAGVCLASDEKFFGGKAGVLDHESLAGTIRRHFA